VLALEGIVLFVMRRSGVRRRIAETSQERKRELRSELEEQTSAEVVAFPQALSAASAEHRRTTRPGEP
jgi:hypothetical protein